MTLSKHNFSFPFKIESLILWLLRLMTVVSGTIIVLMSGFLLWEALPLVQEIGILRFFTDESWHPTSNNYNLVPMILGTLLTSLGAILLATPAGILSAIFSHYYAPPFLAILYRRLVELLAGIPSVVYGFWGLVVLVPLINQLHPPGSSLLAGILILSLMILPTVTLVASSSFSSVPTSYFQSARALGLGQWGIIWGVVLPASKSGVIAGIILATGRALGETMAVLMVAGNVVQVPNSLFAPVRTLTANIALEMGYATASHRSALFVSGLMLMMVIAGLMIIVRKQWR
ncbi:phosphate ABC transporter permease subunit PstC [Euhalothece natronophila Z-M001]|uniref:Phosphate transport system permease protein n=2 Tax=Euhalothece TaxID=65097 RepID=A0A5B8NQD9_9CHRO|nr:phosphate ABC transporter permease subunit PstC [Euhalothece natronophila Z-M001]